VCPLNGAVRVFLDPLFAFGIAFFGDCTLAFVDPGVTLVLEFTRSSVVGVDVQAKRKTVTNVYLITSLKKRHIRNWS
jgi:hypothetical protein